MTIAEFVKLKRHELKMTQVEFARHAGVGLRFIRDLEQGKKRLRMNKANAGGCKNSPAPKPRRAHNFIFWGRKR